MPFTPPPASRRRRRPPQPSSGLPRLAVALLTLATAIIAIGGLRELQNIIGPLLLTVNLIIVAYPVQRRLTRLGVPAAVGAGLTGLLVLLILAVFLGAVTWSFALLAQELPSYQKQFSALYATLIARLAQEGITESQVLQQLQQISPTNIIGVLSDTFSGLVNALTLIVIVVTIVFALTMDLTGWSRRLTIASRFHPRFVEALEDFGSGVRRYWIVSSIFGLAVAALDVVALLRIGVPLAYVWGLLAFLTNYIPNIGFILGILPPALMALLANGPQEALIVIIAYCVINFVVQSVIMPKFLGNAVGVTATAAMVSVLFWAYVLGPLGALLSLPATLLVKALLVDSDPRARWFNAFIASDPETAEEPTQQPS